MKTIEAVKYSATLRKTAYARILKLTLSVCVERNCVTIRLKVIIGVQTKTPTLRNIVSVLEQDPVVW